MTSAPPPPENPNRLTTGPTEGYYSSPRTEFRRARARSQTVVFGSAIIGVIALFLLGFLGVNGALPVPFGGDFSKEEVFAEPGDIPCPTAGARAENPAGVSLRILNTTSTPGLAGSVGASLEELGYTIAGTDNAAQYHGVARIEAGPRGVDAAYTIARYFPGDVRIILNSSEDLSLTILLGNQFTTLVPPEERATLLESKGPLVPLSGCLPVAEPADGWEVPESGQSGQSGQSGASGASGEDQTSVEEGTDEGEG
ncbi:MAG: LytR C-terminal domain-containing protein [Actinomyces sp.]|uniref:LytR C-terminal domain-containing protein n=1 Tax=Schaalia sp. JY-X159 TaxID=2758575 RepID=UPI00165E7600|nr:LytR C-terminal domain-containing protein [Schaalia sp. JY-X159]MBP7880979.1 LytR C-terminal domain-containing protein [Actinomyces sp.]